MIPDDAVDESVVDAISEVLTSLMADCTTRTEALDAILALVSK